MTLSAVGGTLTVSGGSVSVAGEGTPANPAQVQRARVNFSNDGEISLSSAPASGNTLLVFAYGASSPPAGWTTLANDTSDDWILCAKVSDTTEQTVTVTGGTRLEYQEWSGLASLASIYDSGESIETVATASSWDPASVTADQSRAVYLALIGLGNTSGTVTSDWSGADSTYNTSFLLGCHKIVTDGSAFDTAVTWTTSRPRRGGLFVLRGES